MVELGVKIVIIIRKFGKSTHELWDIKNNSVLLIYKISEGKTIKLSVKLDKSETLVVSGYYVDIKDVENEIKRRAYKYIK